METGSGPPARTPWLTSPATVTLPADDSAHDSGPSASVSVPHERTSVRIARQALAENLAEAGVEPESCADAMLVLSELVSNAVKHAAPLPSGEITVRWLVSPDVLHLEITDGGSATHPHASAAALSAGGGRGLNIVRTVSRTWGVTEGHDFVTVWAEIPRGSGVARRPAETRQALRARDIAR